MLFRADKDNNILENYNFLNINRKCSSVICSASNKSMDATSGLIVRISTLMLILLVILESALFI